MKLICPVCYLEFLDMLITTHTHIFNGKAYDVPLVWVVAANIGGKR